MTLIAWNRIECQLPAQPNGFPVRIIIKPGDEVKPSAALSQSEIDRLVAIGAVTAAPPA